MEELIKKIVDHIIKSGKEQLYDNNFQTIVDYRDVHENFASEIEIEIFNMIETKLSEREEIADVEQDSDGFNIVYYTDFIKKQE